MNAVQPIDRTQRKRILITVLAAALVMGVAGSAIGADQITDDNVEAALAAAKTPADHEALATYFTAKSKEAAAQVARHQRMSLAFGGKQRTAWEAHCNSLMKTFEEQAKDYAALAKEQKAVATALAK